MRSVYQEKPFESTFIGSMLHEKQPKLIKSGKFISANYLQGLQVELSKTKEFDLLIFLNHNWKTICCFAFLLET